MAVAAGRHSKPERDPSPAISPPLNYLRFVYEFLLAVLCLPLYFVYFAVLPHKRWRRSWNLREAALMPAIRRILAAFDRCGFKISGRDTPSEPNAWWLKLRYGARFEWVEPLEDGLAGDDDFDGSEPTRVGLFSWTKVGAEEVPSADSFVGIYLHGGAYTHNSAHPRSSSSAIPKKLLQKSSRLSSVFCPEYRLLPDYPFFASLQDAAAAYVALAKRGIPGDRIVLIGDSSGGHLALALTRWVRETINRRDAEMQEKIGAIRLQPPAGLVLFSPWTDPSHSYLGHTADDYIPRPNDCDYLFEVGRFRLHLVTSLLGSRPPSHVESLYISPGRKGVAPGSFTSHPPCFVHYGTGERCQAEGERLVENLRRDAVRVEQVVTEDTPHDPLLLEMLWNRQQIQQIWDGALQFLGTL